MTTFGVVYIAYCVIPYSRGIDSNCFDSHGGISTTLFTSRSLSKILEYVLYLFSAENGA